MQNISYILRKWSYLIVYFDLLLLCWCLEVDALVAALDSAVTIYFGTNTCYVPLYIGITDAFIGR